MSHPTDSDTPSLPDDALERGRACLGEAEHVLVLTGAGVSVASGMPTFRGEEGMWKEHRPRDLATPDAFARDPRTVWEWYEWRREQARACSPNPAHRWLARWCLADPGVTLVTQNVDDLHRRALQEALAERKGAATARRGGAGGQRDERGPVELHGNLFRVRCTDCGRRDELRSPADTSTRDSLPQCRGCGGLLRPDVVWFGESLDADVLDAAFAAARRAGACLVVGTSAAVQPAASLATEAAASGANVVEVNPESTPVSRVAAVTLRAGAARAVPALLRPILEQGG